MVVTVDPDILPPTLGNSLFAVRSGADVDLRWAAVVETRSYRIFRSLVKNPWPPLPLLENITGLASLLPDVPAPPNDPL